MCNGDESYPVTVYGLANTRDASGRRRPADARCPCEAATGRSRDRRSGGLCLKAMAEERACVLGACDAVRVRQWRSRGRPSDAAHRPGVPPRGLPALKLARANPLARDSASSSGGSIIGRPLPHGPSAFRTPPATPSCSHGHGAPTTGGWVVAAHRCAARPGQPRTPGRAQAGLRALPGDRRALHPLRLGTARSDRAQGIAGWLMGR